MERYIKYLSTLAALFVFWIITFLAGARLFGCGFGTLEEYLERYWGGFSSVNVRCIYWLLLQLPVYLWIYFRQIGRMKWIYPQILLRGGNFRRYHRLEMLKNAGLVLGYYFMGVGEMYLLSSFCGDTVIGDISFVVQTLFRQTVGMGSLLLFALILHEAAFPAVESCAVRYDTWRQIGFHSESDGAGCRRGADSVSYIGYDMFGAALGD